MELSILNHAKNVLKIEAESILALVERLDESFVRAVETIYASKGRVIVTGLGKSGLVGRKIVATLTSTGTPAIFLHPVEGLHGDLGIVTKDDVILAISNSGETHEVNTIVKNIRQIGIPVISFTGRSDSTLARMSDVIVDVGVEREACPFGLAPTSSSTAALAMGDALAIALVHKRDFKEQDFFKFHPGGHLGARLRSKVRDIMIQGTMVPKVLSGTPMRVAIEEMDTKNRGFVLVVDSHNVLNGILTDGDVRRLVRSGRSFMENPIDEFMTKNPKTIDENTSIAETIETMQRLEITTLVVIDQDKRLRGYIHLHDILGRGGTIKISI